MQTLVFTSSPPLPSDLINPNAAMADDDDEEFPSLLDPSATAPPSPPPNYSPSTPDLTAHHHHNLHQKHTFSFADYHNNNNSSSSFAGAAQVTVAASAPPPAPDPEKQQEQKRKERDDVSSDGGSSWTAAKKVRPLLSMSGGAEYRKDREEWSDEEIGCLLDMYTERYVQLNRGNLRERDWEDVAIIVTERCDKHKAGKSVEQCKNKTDNLKKRYKAECQRLSSGALSVSHWPWFRKMELIVSSSSPCLTTKTTVDNDDKAQGRSSTPKLTKRYSTALANAATNLMMKSLSAPKWKRVVLKISGSTLAGSGPQNVDPKVPLLIVREIAMVNHVGVEVAIVVRGRNFFCGDTWVAATCTDRAIAYQIRMMASVMNSLLLQTLLEKIGVPTRVQTAFTMHEIAEPYMKRRAIRHLEKGRVVIFGGIGAATESPLFSSDTAAALKASEYAVLKGTNVDGINDCSSSRNSNVVAFENISFRELVSRGFTAMDMTAITFCEENNIPVFVFNLLEPGNIWRALFGDQVGTLIDQSGRIS